MDEWRDVANRLVTGFHRQSGLFEQFAGYFGLEDIDLADYAGRTVPMDVVLGRERTQGSQVLKQADVVALFAMLPDAYDEQVQATNFRYYEPRCGHGSSLSRGLHALVAARLGDVALAERYFHETAAIDLADTTSGSAGGVRIAALGGLWQAAIFGFAGLSLHDGRLRLRSPPAGGLARAGVPAVLARQPSARAARRERADADRDARARQAADPSGGRPGEPTPAGASSAADVAE